MPAVSGKKNNWPETPKKHQLVAGESEDLSRQKKCRRTFSSARYLMCSRCHFAVVGVVVVVVTAVVAVSMSAGAVQAGVIWLNISAPSGQQFSFG